MARKAQEARSQRRIATGWLLPFQQRGRKEPAGSLIVGEVDLYRSGCGSRMQGEGDMRWRVVPTSHFYDE